MLKKLFILFAIAAAMWQPAAAGELTFGWNKFIDYGQIWDMEFMPDNNFFIMMTDTCFEVRNTETGDLVNTYPKPGYGAPQGFEFTPDSTKIILYCGDIMEVRNVSDMSIIHHFVIPQGTDTAGYDIVSSNIRFYEAVVDPIKPYVYALRSREGYLSGGKYFVIRKIVIYNYETMEEVGILSTEEDYTVFEKMAISNDGKYLAVNSGLSSHLRVWDLETRQKIRDYKICDYYSGGGGDGQPSCTKFSEINTDLIYFSGRFPLPYGNYNYNGLLIYSILENKIIDTTFAVPPNYVLQGYFTFFDNEERTIKLMDNFIVILNIKNKIIEQKINRDTIQNGTVHGFGRIKYSQDKKIFLGFGNTYFGYCKNNLNTGINEQITYDSIIYPNPNTGFVLLQTNCQNENQSYVVFDINGLVIIPTTIITTQTGITTIDISILPTGTYFLRFHCGSTVTTYKVIKEN